MDFIRSLPRDTRRRALPWVRRIIHSKDGLIAAIDDIMARGGDTSVMERWDVSLVTDFSHVFDAYRNRLLAKFNADLSGWDVSNATNLSCMFNGCSSFNSDLSRWNVSNATDLSYMFWDCTAFNSDVSGWNVSNAIYFRGMFEGCRSFSSDVSRWNVSNAIYLSGMF
jgi:surface protein